ncbi:hypothetical protein HanIR_Chr13g0638911 [Helianthus annuus]|nr:hypothetical protein HanIR_Chr13g0638911 [Helianthus annuus]
MNNTNRSLHNAVGFLSLFTIKLYHSGIFTRFPDRAYVEGECNFIDLLDEDKFSVHEMDCIVDKFGLPSDIERYYHFLVPGENLDFGLRALGSDADVLDFIKVIPQSRVMNVYCEYAITTVYTYFCSPTKFRVQEITDEEIMAMENINASKNRLLLEWNGSVENDVGQSSVQLETGHISVGHEVGQSSVHYEIDITMDDLDFDPFFGENPVNQSDSVQHKLNDVAVNESDSVTPRYFHVLPVGPVGSIVT